MKSNNKLTKSDTCKKSVLNYDGMSLCKHNLEKGLKEFVILRQAYELIFEDSQFFYEQLAIAFSIESRRSTA